MYMFAYPDGMSQFEVSTVAHARAALSTTLREFRSNADASPVVLGSHRKAEAVILPFRRYERLADQAPRPSVLQRLHECRDVILRLAALSKIEAVAVFGSVARGEDRPESDIDLLVTTVPGASYFDFAQFAIDIEQITGRKVDVVSRTTLDPARDADILRDAMDL